LSDAQKTEHLASPCSLPLGRRFGRAGAGSIRGRPGGRPEGLGLDEETSEPLGGRPRAWPGERMHGPPAALALRTPPTSAL